jgi:Phage integrase family
LSFVPVDAGASALHFFSTSNGLRREILQRDLFFEISQEPFEPRDALVGEVIQLALEAEKIPWYGWHAFRRGLATNLHRLGVSDKVIQQILRHANVTTTINIYVKMVTRDAEDAMKRLESSCSLTVPQLQFESRKLGARTGDEGTHKSLTLEAVRENLAERGDCNCCC